MPWLPFYADTSCAWAACGAASGLKELQEAHEQRGKDAAAPLPARDRPNCLWEERRALKEGWEGRRLAGLNGGLGFNAGKVRKQ